MFDKLTTMVVVARSMFANRLVGGRDRGATALEYVGMIVVAGLIVTAVSTGVNAAGVGDKVTTAVNNILGGGANP